MIQRISKRGRVNEGTPPKYETVEEMQVMIDKYFEDCSDNREPKTITGLALALGFTSRQDILNYEGKKEFSDAIKNARLQIEHFNEKALYSKVVSTAGVIFNLTNNYGWRNEMYNKIEDNGLTDEEIEILDKFKKTAKGTIQNL